MARPAQPHPQPLSTGEGSQKKTYTDLKTALGRFSGGCTGWPLRAGGFLPPTRLPAERQSGGRRKSRPPGTYPNRRTALGLARKGQPSAPAGSYPVGRPNRSAIVGAEPCRVRPRASAERQVGGKLSLCCSHRCGEQYRMGRLPAGRDYCLVVKLKIQVYPAAPFWYYP